MYLKTKVLTHSNPYEAAALLLLYSHQKKNPIFEHHHRLKPEETLRCLTAMYLKAGKKGFRLLSNFTHLVKNSWSELILQYLWTGFLLRVKNCSLHQRIPSTYLALVLLSIIHICICETTLRWLKPNKTRLTPQSTYGFGEFLLPFQDTLPIHGFTGTPLLLRPPMG